VPNSRGFFASNSGFTGEVAASGLLDQNHPTTIAMAASARNAGASNEAKWRLKRAMRATIRRYITRTTSRSRRQTNKDVALWPLCAQ
jgi:hypothetical protein